MTTTVSIVKCDRYGEEEVFEGLRRSIDLIGGIKSFVHRGNLVLLKPNLLYGKAPEKAVTTHPSVVKGMIRIVRDAGGIPFIGDSPSIGSVKRAAEKAGIKTVADEMKCPLVEFDQPMLSLRKGAKVFKQMEIDRAVLEADVVINLPKWKTHGMMVLTLGVKNLLGCVPGTRKALWHLKAGEDHKLFAQMLLDLYLMIQPSLTILDGIVGMEGNGPGSGNPIPLGLILASRDPLCLDQIVCDLLGISRKSLLTNRMAFKEGLGKGLIEAVGESVESVRIRRFQLPPLSSPDWNLPGFLKETMKNALTSRPVFKEGLCDHCDQCLNVCPPKALGRKEGSLIFDYGKCIRCFCCQEVCQEGAITIQQGWALRLRSKVKGKRKALSLML